MNGTTLQSSQFLNSVADLDWEVGAVGDFTKNGQVEILWRHRTSGEIVVWEMNDTICS